MSQREAVYRAIVEVMEKEPDGEEIELTDEQKDCVYAILDQSIFSGAIEPSKEDRDVPDLVDFWLHEDERLNGGGRPASPDIFTWPKPRDSSKPSGEEILKTLKALLKITPHPLMSAKVLTAISQQHVELTIEREVGELPPRLRPLILDFVKAVHTSHKEKVATLKALADNYFEEPEIEEALKDLIAALPPSSPTWRMVEEMQLDGMNGNAGLTVPKCPLRFEGPVSDFILRHPGNFLTPQGMSFGHEEVVRALEESPMLLLRGFGRYNKSAQRYFAADDNALEFTVGDNEGPMWSWRRLWGLGRTQSRAVPFLVEAIRNQQIPISMAPATGEDERDWATWGTGDHPRPSNRWRGIQGGRWKLCHIFRAAPGYLSDSAADIRARFVRNFHPMNHFFFASDYVWAHAGRFEMKPVAQLGEWPAVCLTLWNQYREAFPAEANWFFKHAKVTPYELALPAGIEANPTVVFEWKPAGTAARAHHGPSTGENVVAVRETTTGRFHLGGFGRTRGGLNRDVPFRFQVFDAEENVVAESTPTTAEELGIAVKGRVDYDRDNFHQTDFFVSRDGSQPEPHSPIARRATWIPKSS